MSVERFERIEGMISQLITMVGNMQKSMNGFQKSMSEMHTVQKEHGQKFEVIESKLDALESRNDNMESKNEARHIEVIQQIKRLEKDQDFIWEKAARNERELEIMKRSSES